jgi:hypothetical protein
MTWLDWYIRSRTDAVRAEFHRQGWLVPRNPDGTENIVGALGGLNEFAILEFSADRRGFEQREGGPKNAHMTALMGACLLPFLSGFIPADLRSEGLARGPGLGLVLTRETADMLANASPPAGDAWRQRLFGPKPEGAGLGGVYIDVPHGAVLIGRNYQLRALFAIPWRQRADESDENSNIICTGAVLLVSVITAPGSERVEGNVFLVVDEQDHINYMRAPDSSILGFVDYQTEEDAEWGSQLKPAEVFHILYERTVEFFRLVLAYYHYGPVEARVKIGVTPIEIFARNRNRPRKAESIFAMLRLAAPADRLGRALPSLRAGWMLTARQEVAGHFKLQPYGPGQASRKLIWVASYQRGPEQAPIRPRAVHL